MNMNFFLNSIIYTKFPFSRLFRFSLILLNFFLNRFVLLAIFHENMSTKEQEQEMTSFFYIPGM